MNNYMPIALMAALMAGNNGDGNNNISKVLSLLGMNGDGSAGNDFGELNKLLGGNISMESILPMLLKSISGENSNSPQKKNARFGDERAEESARPETTYGENAPNYLLPITDIAGDEINYALSHYFANN